MVNTTLYDPNVYGAGIEGVLNWSNSYVDGWFSTAFIAMIWIVSTYVLIKSEWKISSVLSFTSFLVLMLSIIMSLFMSVNGYIIWVSAIIFAVSLSASIIDRR